MNQFEINGVKYKEMPNVIGKCIGCAFEHKHDLCLESPKCRNIGPDQIHVIFMEVKDGKN